MFAIFKHTNPQLSQLVLQIQLKFINPLKNLRRLGIKLVADFFSDFETFNFSVEEIDAVFHAVVWLQVRAVWSCKLVHFSFYPGLFSILPIGMVWALGRRWRGNARTKLLDVFNIKLLLCHTNFNFLFFRSPDLLLRANILLPLYSKSFTSGAKTLGKVRTSYSAGLDRFPQKIFLCFS